MPQNKLKVQKKSVVCTVKIFLFFIKIFLIGCYTLLFLRTCFLKHKVKNLLILKKKQQCLCCNHFLHPHSYVELYEGKSVCFVREGY